MKLSVVSIIFGLVSGTPALTGASLTSLTESRRAAVSQQKQHVERQLVDLRAQQHQHQERALQTGAGESLSDADNQAFCETVLLVFFGAGSGCTCVLTADGTDYEPNCDALLESCVLCEPLQGQETCFNFDLEAALAAETSETEASCVTYTSGVFDNTICQIRNLVDGSCAVTVDGAECNSCTVIACDEGESFFDDAVDFDCSNLIAGEVWNVCVDDIPETSPFIFARNNGNLFNFDRCFSDTGSSDLEINKGLCEATLDIFLGTATGCTCVLTADGTDYEADCDDIFDGIDGIFEDCVLCEPLQGQETCLIFDFEAALAAETSETEANCVTYTSGVFDNTICQVNNQVDGSCAITVDGVECNACTVIICGEGTSFEIDGVDFDCSNLIAGEVWNVCVDDIPETSPFIFAGNNGNFFDFEECFFDTDPPDLSSASSLAPAAGPSASSGELTSGGSMMASHTICVVLGLVLIVAIY
jgi:hypothetical protein